MTFNKKRVFVSGGSGVIGSYLIEQLISQKAIIFVGDLKSCPPKWRGKLLYRQGDLNYISKEEIEQFAPEYFFHLAATFERSAETYDFWDDNFHNNIKLSHHLMTIFKEIKTLKKVIFASSYLIFDSDLYLTNSAQNKPKTLNELSPIKPRNLTGMAKLACEIELEFLAQFKSSNFSSVSARIYRSYGKNSRDVISRWIRSLLKNESINVYAEQGIFDYIYAGDVAEGLIHLAKTFKGDGVVNLGTGNSRKVVDILSVLKKHFPSMKYKTINSEIEKFESSEADMNKYYKITGWKPNKTLEEAITEIIAFEKNNKNNQLNELSLVNSVLVTSISDKIPLIKAVKKSLRKFSGTSSKVIGSDSDSNCIGKYFVDQFWKMPKIDKLKIMDLIKYCHKNNIKFIIPTRDGELVYFSNHKKILEENGIYVMISKTKSIETCVDKLSFYKFGKNHDLPIINTTINIDKIESQYFVVKERFGAGSKKIGLKLTKKEAIEWAKKIESPIYQPFIIGKEASIDVYINKHNKPVGIVPRWREMVVDGESKITSSFNNEKLVRIINKFIRQISLQGHIIIQVLIDDNNEIQIIECNPRFGGASTLSLVAGLDSFYWFFIESIGQNISVTSPTQNLKGLTQIRYKNDIIISK